MVLLVGGSTLRVGDLPEEILYWREGEADEALTLIITAYRGAEFVRTEFPMYGARATPRGDFSGGRSGGFFAQESLCETEIPRDRLRALPNAKKDRIFDGIPLRVWEVRSMPLSGEARFGPRWDRI